ncbi:MAG: hypothetical protein E4G97_07470 [Deltaproteobacteria bacterium]|jgi:hypothetical protein|nr:MAG: hypothetical protein E4G97_07470 [Deltaproteobacteria bacterium]
MSRRGLLLPVVGFLVLSLGCAAAPPKKDYAAFHAANPRSILVVPVINNTNNVEAPGLFLSTMPIPVAERGYYVFPVNMVRRVLEDEGLSDANLVHTADTARLCNLFGADSVLYVSIEAWTAQYLLITTQVTVEFDYVMKDGKTGDTIWKEHKKVVYAPQQQSGGSPLAALVAAAVQAAVTKAAPNYMPLARQANAEVINTPGVGLPAGPHNREYGKDTVSAK